MNKIISVALSFLLLLFLNTPTFAENVVLKNNSNGKIGLTDDEMETLMDGQLGALLYSIKCNPSEFGFSAEELDGAYLGASFIISNVEPTYSESPTEITYLPIIKSEDVIAIVTVIKSNDQYCITIGKDFASKLNKCLDDVESNITLVSTGGNIIAIDDESNIFTISAFDSVEVDDISNSISTYSVTASEGNIGNVVSKKDILEYQYSIPEIGSTGILFSSYPDVTVYEKSLSNYPTIQGSGGECWAAVVASMVEYETGGYFSVGNVYDKTSIEAGRGATSSEITLALDICLPSQYVPTHYSRRMNNSEIKTIINNDDPACMLAVSTNTGKTEGHATALCGYHLTAYENNLLNSITIMEPHYQCIRTVSFMSSEITYSIDEYVFKWTETIRLLYN